MPAGVELAGLGEGEEDVGLEEIGEDVSVGVELGPSRGSPGGLGPTLGAAALSVAASLLVEVLVEVGASGGIDVDSLPSSTRQSAPVPVSSTSRDGVELQEQSQKSDGANCCGQLHDFSFR